MGKETILQRLLLFGTRRITMRLRGFVRSRELRETQTNLTRVNTTVTCQDDHVTRRLYVYFFCELLRLLYFRRLCDNSYLKLKHNYELSDLNQYIIFSIIILVFSSWTNSYGYTFMFFSQHYPLDHRLSCFGEFYRLNLINFWVNAQIRLR